MMRSFDALALRQMRARKLRALLTGFGVVLGVGMMFGVLVLTGTIRHTFSELIDSAWGTTDLIITGPGNSGLVPDRVVEQVRATPGVDETSAMIGAEVVRLDARGRPIRGMKGKVSLAGYDTAGPAPFDFKFVAGRSVNAGNEIEVERNWARDRGIHVGDVMPVAAASGRADLRVVGLFKFSSGLSFGGQGLAGMPLPEARRLMDIPSGLMQVYVRARDRSRVGELRQRLRSDLGSGVEIKTPKGFGEEVTQQLQAFNIVLYFFGAIALFVGGYLILNSFNMTVLQRMRELGMLRTLGATRGMIMRTVLVEAAVLGAVGSVLGLGLGLGLALGLVAMMKSLGVPIGNLQVAPGTAVVAVAMGLLVTAIGALRPARRAARTEPIRAVLGAAPTRKSGGDVRRALLGLGLFLPGVLLGGDFWFGTGNSGSFGDTVLGMGITMAMFAGMALAAPFLILPIVRLLSAPLRRLLPTGGRLAVDSVRSNPARTAATAVALTIGISVFVVNSGMSASFLGTISDQIDANYARDFAVQPVGFQIENGGGSAVAQSVRRQIAAMPETGVVTPVRIMLIKLPRVHEAVDTGLVMAFDPAAFGKVDKTPVRGISRDAALRNVARGDVLISARYAGSAHLKRGDRLPLNGPSGRRSPRVAGVLNGVGAGEELQMSLATMRGIYGVTSDNQLLVNARSESQRPALERRVQAMIDRGQPGLELASTGDTKAQIKSEINKQFGMFNAIVGVAIIVSLLGVINTLAMSVMERTREIGVLRAMGSSRWLVRRTMLDESLLITTAGSIAGLLLGSVIAFSWVGSVESLLPGISFRLPVGATLLVVAVAVILGVIASILPARRAGRLDVIDALNYE